MNGWWFVTDNSYYSITDNTGKFKLTDVLRARRPSLSGMRLRETKQNVKRKT